MIKHSDRNLRQKRKVLAMFFTVKINVNFDNKFSFETRLPEDSVTLTGAII